MVHHPDRAGVIAFQRLWPHETGGVGFQRLWPHETRV